MEMKRTLKTIFFIPNIPFVIILSIYILIQIYKHTGVVEMEFVEKKDILTDEIKKFIDRVYPQHFRYAWAVLFYLWLGLNTFK